MVCNVWLSQNRTKMSSKPAKYVKEETKEEDFDDFLYSYFVDVKPELPQNIKTETEDSPTASGQDFLNTNDIKEEVKEEDDVGQHSDGGSNAKCKSTIYHRFIYPV